MHASSVRTGLPGGSPNSHVFDMILEGSRRSRAARAGAHALGINPLSDASCRKCSSRPTASRPPLRSGSLSWAQISAPLLPIPEEFHWRKLPVDACMQRRRCRIVRQGRGDVTRRTYDGLCPDAAFSAMDIHAVYSGFAFAGRRPDRNTPRIDVTIGTARMCHHRFDSLPGVQSIGAADAARWQCIRRLLSPRRLPSGRRSMSWRARSRSALSSWPALTRNR